MTPFKTERGFRGFEHPAYYTSVGRRVIQETCLIGKDKDSITRPKSSFLWLSDEILLDRQDVKKLVKILKYWLRNKRLPER